MLGEEIQTLNASFIGVQYNHHVVNIYVRTDDDMLVITEKLDNIVVYLKMLKSVYAQVFELYVGDHCKKKYRIRLPLKNFELISKELQPLINDLSITQISRIS